METIGLVVAMPQEVRPLLAYAMGWKRAAIGKFPGYRFELSGRECLLVRCGIGLESAILAGRALLAEVQPKLLVSFGVGGGVTDDLSVGDVVLGRESCELYVAELSNFRPLAPLTDQAQEAITQALRPHDAKVVWGTIVTTPGSQTIQPRPEILHPVLDMETAGVARIATEAGIPLLALRALSDTPREPIPFNIQAFTSGRWSTRLRRMTGTILRHPGILNRLVRLGRNTEKAAQNAALALATALSQPILSSEAPG
jgi:adenosylhomocysteine nucleosidase